MSFKLEVLVQKEKKCFFFFVCFVFIYMPEKLDDTSFGIIYIYIIFIYKAIEVSAVKKKREEEPRFF